MPSLESTSAGDPAIAFRLAVDEDDSLLFDFFREARADDFAVLGWDDEEIDTLLRRQFEAQRRDYDARFPDAEKRIATLDGVDVALLWVLHIDKEIRLLDFVVRTSSRNAGIGACLLRILQTEAQAAGVPLRHMVAVSNERARRLYERTGFVVVSDAGSHLLMEWIPPMSLSD